MIMISLGLLNCLFDFDDSLRYMDQILMYYMSNFKADKSLYAKVCPNQYREMFKVVVSCCARQSYVLKHWPIIDKINHPKLPKKLVSAGI